MSTRPLALVRSTTAALAAVIMAACTGTARDAGHEGSSSPEAELAADLGKPARLLVGLGSTDHSDIEAQGITPDIFERYLVGSGQNLESGWQTWNSPEGAYVNVVANAADAVGAVPMFTFYMSTARGEGNLAYLGDSTYMAEYWRLTKLLFQRIAIYGKPALVSVEPDFWGFVESQAPGGDPTRVAVQVTVVPDCAAYANDLTGMAACFIQLARTYAPKARIGFPPSAWGAPSLDENIAFMKKVGVGAADFTVLQTVDRDAVATRRAATTPAHEPSPTWTSRTRRARTSTSTSRQRRSIAMASGGRSSGGRLRSEFRAARPAARRTTTGTTASTTS